MIADRLDPYQTEAVDFILSREAAALFYEQGTGKTWVTAGVIERLPPDSRVLLIVPLANVETTWVRMMAELDVDVHRTWESYARTRRCVCARPQVLLVHYEALSGFIKRARIVRWSLIAYDESQRLKARGSKYSRTAARFKYADRRLILSGTPIEQHTIDLFGQFRFLDKNLLGSWTRFDEKWLMKTGYMGYKRKMRPGLVPRFLKLIAPYIRRVTKEEVLDLPPLKLRDVPVTMYGRQAELYDTMERDSLVVINDKTVPAELKITQLVRLSQICGGFITTGYVTRRTKRGTIRRVSPITESIGQAKLRKVKGILTREVSPTNPVVIFCRARHEIADLVRACSGWRVAEFHGKVKRKERVRILRAFQRGKYDVLVCQVRTGGVGVDLYRSHTGIVYSTTFSYIDYDQMLARLHRRGQLHPVTIYRVFCQKTVDEDIMTAVQQKKKVTEYCFRAIKTRRPVMGKKDKNKDKPKATETPKAEPAKTEAPAKPAEPAFKYGVKDLAEKLGTKAASVRVRLRNHGIPKAGKSYGWNTKDELNAVIAKLNEKTAAKAKDDDADDDDDDEDDEDE